MRNKHMDLEQMQEIGINVPKNYEYIVKYFFEYVRVYHLFVRIIHH